MRWVSGLLVAGAFVLGVLLFMPWTCWDAECAADATDCRSSGCDNALGLTFDGRSPGIGLAGGVATAAVAAVLLRGPAAIRSLGAPGR